MRRMDEEEENHEDNNLKVFVRVRPLLPRELLAECTFSIVTPQLP
jgi:hypothetical protein